MSRLESCSIQLAGGVLRAGRDKGVGMGGWEPGGVSDKGKGLKHTSGRRLDLRARC